MPPSVDPNVEPVPARIRAAIDRGVAAAMTKIFGQDEPEISGSPLTRSAPAAPPSSEPAPAIAHLTESAEALMKKNSEPTDSIVRIRQDLVEMPVEAQMMWLETFYEAKEYVKQHPEMPRQYPINTAWQAVNTEFDAQKGWAPRGEPAKPAAKEELQELAASLKDASSEEIPRITDAIEKKMRWALHGCPAIQEYIQSLDTAEGRRAAIIEQELTALAGEVVPPIVLEIQASSVAGDLERTKRAEQALYNLVSAASADQRITDIIKKAKEVGDMPIRAQVDFDAKVGKYVVRHANFLKPVTFADRRSAEAMAKTIDQETLPKVTRENGLFQVAHADWASPVGVKTAAEAVAVVEKKLQDLGDAEASAKAEAETVVTQAAIVRADHVAPELLEAELKEMGYGPEQVTEMMARVKPQAARVTADAPGGTAEAPVEMGWLTPEALTTMQELAALLHIPEGELMKRLKDLKQEGTSHMESVQAATKRGKDTVSGFPKSDVSAPAGKHPNIPGQVSTEGPALATIEPGKPGAAAAKFDGTTKTDPDKSKVDGQHGLTREQQTLLMAKASAFDSQVDIRVRAARALTDAQRLASSPRGLAALEAALVNVVKATTEEAQEFIGEKIKKLREEGKPEDQSVAAAHSMARAEGYAVPESK